MPRCGTSCGLLLCAVGEVGAHYERQEQQGDVGENGCQRREVCHDEFGVGERGEASQQCIDHGEFAIE